MAVATEPEVAAVDAADPVGELSGRLFMEGVGALHLLTVYLGVRLGLYRALAGEGALTSVKLASHTGLDERYVREWLQAETIAGLVSADADDMSAATFRLAPGVETVLVDETSPAYLGGLGEAAAAVGGAVHAVRDAFRTGAGVPLSAYPPEAVSAQSSLNRPAFVNALVGEWLPAIPDVNARLRDTSRPARIADVGCGSGWAAIELARAFPHVRVDGYDGDEASIENARQNAQERSLTDRVTFEVADAMTTGFGGQTYDVITFFECLHDMARPADALRRARAALAPGGQIIVMDERAGEQPLIGDPTETFFATASVLWCLPQSRADADCDTPGTLLRPDVLRGIAQRAGFKGVEVLPIDHPFWRFYRIVP